MAWYQPWKESPSWLQKAGSIARRSVSWFLCDTPPISCETRKPGAGSKSSGSNGSPTRSGPPRNNRPLAFIRARIKDGWLELEVEDVETGDFSHLDIALGPGDKKFIRKLFPKRWQVATYLHSPAHDAEPGGWPRDAEMSTKINEALGAMPDGLRTG